MNEESFSKLVDAGAALAAEARERAERQDPTALLFSTWGGAVSEAVVFMRAEGHGHLQTINDLVGYLHRRATR